jgi:hypothetical protein
MEKLPLLNVSREGSDRPACFQRPSVDVAPRDGDWAKAGAVDEAAIARDKHATRAILFPVLRRVNPGLISRLGLSAFHFAATV